MVWIVWKHMSLLLLAKKLQPLLKAGVTFNTETTLSRFLAKLLTVNILYLNRNLF